MNVKQSLPLAGRAATGDIDSYLSAGIGEEMRRAGRTANLNDKGSPSPRPSPPGEGEMAKIPGQGMSPTGAPTTEDSPVITGKQDQKILTGEGEVTDPASDVDAASLEQGDGPNGGDGGDGGGQSVGMDEGSPSPRPSPPGEGEVTKDYQAPGPDSPYPDGPGNPSSDPLTPQVGSAGITPSPMDTVLRQPTGISGEIGGRETGDEDASVMGYFQNEKNIH